MTSERRASVLGCLALALVAWAAAPSIAVAQRDFEATVRDALAEFEAGRWTEARALFLEAHAIRPSAEALRMAGNASYEAREYVRAVELLEQALSETDGPLREDRAALARDALAAANRFVGRLTLVVPEGARVRIDELDRDASEPLLLVRGTHQVEVAALGFETHRARVTIDGAERTVHVTLRPAVATPPPEPRAVSREPADGADPPEWVWVLVGIAAAGVIAGAVGIAVAAQPGAPLGANAPDRVIYALEVGR